MNAHNDFTAAAHPQADSRCLLLLGGFLGAGKTVIVDRHLARSQTVHPAGYVIIDPDDFKVGLLRSGGLPTPTDLTRYGLDPATILL